MDKQLKYICEKCDFKVNTKARWEAHIKSELHLTGQRKKRSDYKEPLKCVDCEYTSKNNITMKTHILNFHKTKDDRIKEFKFYCINCDFGSFSKDIIEKHNNTEKHKHFITLNK